MDANERCDVDVLVLPHDGSDRTVSAKFFEAIQADHYVILGDGGHGNPDVQTFRWLLEARKNSKRPFTIYLTRHTEAFIQAHRSRPDHAGKLLTLFRQAKERRIPFRVLHPKDAGEPFAIHLLQPPATSVDTLIELVFQILAFAKTCPPLESTTAANCPIATELA